jgi:hypothetical protein
VLQLLSEVPAGQHVLLLVLHAADSASFNRSLLGVMLARAERLLDSSPASLAAAGGLGHQAASLAALGSYCSYLCFVAGAVAEPAAASNSSSQAESHLLQQQPVLDIASFLQGMLAKCSSSSDGSSNMPGNEDRSSSWQLALSVPFACAVLRFAGFSPSAASSVSVAVALQQLQQLQSLPCMAPTHEDYGRLPACISSCLAGCQMLLQPDATAHQPVCEFAAPEQQQDSGNDTALRAAANEVLSKVVADGSALVDDVYWAVCSPGLQQLTGLLAEVTAAAARQQQQQQQQGRGSQSVDKAAKGRDFATAGAAGGSAAAAAGAADNFAVSRRAASVKQDAAMGPTPPAATAAAAEAVTAAAAADRSNSSSPSAAAGPPRHATPLLLAPRVPPPLEAPPVCIAAALAAVGDPVVQQLQQAFIAQYSTDDTPVSNTGSCYRCSACYVQKSPRHITWFAWLRLVELLQRNPQLLCWLTLSMPAGDCTPMLWAAG